jgi:hypothetical protein
MTPPLIAQNGAVGFIRRVTATDERAIQTEGNKSVPWSSLQIEFVERTSREKGERRAEHQRRH